MIHALVAVVLAVAVVLELAVAVVETVVVAEAAVVAAVVAVVVVAVVVAALAGHGRGGGGRGEGGRSGTANFNHHSLQPESGWSGLMVEIRFSQSRATGGTASTTRIGRRLQPPARGPR